MGIENLPSVEGISGMGFVTLIAGEGIGSPAKSDWSDGGALGLLAVPSVGKLVRCETGLPIS
jgi:hypothetical protein